MATIKSFTDLEQSKKLAEILPLESADLYYDRYGDPYFINVSVTHERIKNDKYHHLIPCWSLAALMKIIEIDKSEICFDCYGEKYRVNVHYQTFGSFCQDNELYKSKIDALLAMIIKLHKRNLL